MRKKIYITVNTLFLIIYSIGTLIWIQIDRLNASSYPPGDISNEDKISNLFLYPGLLLIISIVLFILFFINKKPFPILLVCVTILLNILIYTPILYYIMYK